MPHPTPIRAALPAAALALALSACGSDVPPPTEPVGDCTPETTHSLQVGEAREFRAGESRRLCFAGASGGADYVATLVSTAATPTERLTAQILGTGVIPVAPPPQPAMTPSTAAILHEMDHPGANLRAHRRIREMERRDLTPLIGSGPRSPLGGWSAGAPAGNPPAVGALLSLNANGNNACDTAITRTGRVRAVSQKAIVVADTLNPNGGFTDADYEGFAAAFDTLVAPLAERNFGGVTDLDGNGRVILFFTQEVNRLNDPDDDGLIRGFFFARDLFPRTASQGLQGCPTSNVAEILYLLVPDPDGATGGPDISLDFVRRFALATIAHELQHLTNAAQRLHIVQSGVPFEAVWLDEALAHLTEELLFYEAAGLQPRQNLGLPQLQAGGQRVIDAYNRHQISNLLLLAEFLEAPHDHSPYTEDSLETRGAGWHFLRYALDRRGGDETQPLRALVQSQTAGYQNLSSAFGGAGTIQDWITDWSVALYADERVGGMEARYRDRSWNHASIFEAVNVTPYPIRVRNLAGGSPVVETVVGGGRSYFRFGAPAGEGASVEFTAGGGNLPNTARVVVTRTR